MRWLKRYFKKTEEKKQNGTDERFRTAIQKVVPLGNSYVDIFNEIELIKFNKVNDKPYSRPLEVTVKWRRSMELSYFTINDLSYFTINYRSYGDLDDEHFIDEFCSYLESRYNDYREKLIKNFTDKIGDVTADG